MKSYKKNKREKLIVKVNKLGLSLVIVMFLFEFLLALEFNSGIVSGAVGTAYQSFTYSEPSSNTQYITPGVGSSYLSQHAAEYWPNLNNPDKCEAGTDFVMAIRPGSCTPQIVRSDLLEEQNVPVFCKVDLIKVNPLIDVSQLKSVRFTGSNNPAVAGVNFHPNVQNIYSQKGFLENPFFDDVGYVVVLLKRIPVEKDMPESIKVNLTGVLSYSAEGLFGAGQNTYYLKTLDYDEWSKNYNENSFFKGKGFLKADYVDDDGAGISIYLDKENKLVSLDLKKGEGSRDIYLPGFYCKAKIQVRLDDIVADVNKVKLMVGDDYFWLVNGEKFLDGKCQVTSISKASVKVNNADVTRKKVRISCRGGVNKELYIDVGASGVLAQKGCVARDDAANICASVRQNENSCLQLIGCDWKDNKCIPAPELCGSIPEAQKTNCIGACEWKELTNQVVSEDVQKNFEKAREQAYSIGELYGGVAAANGAGKVYAAEAIFEVGVLAGNLGLKSEAADAYNKLINEYPASSLTSTSSSLLTDAEQRLKQLQTPGVTDAYKDGIKISLIDVSIPAKEDASADFYVAKINTGPTTPDNTMPNTDKIQEGEEFASENGNDRFKLDKLYPDRVDLTYYKEIKEERKNGEKTITKIPEKFSLTYANNFKTFDDYRISLLDIKMERIAKVSVIASTPSAYSNANFGFEIGIEKRAIQLSPEKIKEKINGLNKTIEQWEGIVNKLGNAVKALKGACFATSAVLLVKNFFSNLGGGATARQKVMPAYYTQCTKDVGNDKQAFSQCLESKNDEIEKSVKLAEEKIKSTQKDLVEVQNNNLVPGTSAVDRDKARAAYLSKVSIDSSLTSDSPPTIDNDNVQKYASLTQLRDINFWNSMYISSDGVMKEYARDRIAEIGRNIDFKSENQNNKEAYAEKTTNWVRNVPIEFYTSGKAKGGAMIIPLPKAYAEKTGFYVYVPENQYTEQKDVSGFFYIQNIGKDGVLDVSSDLKTSITMAYEVRDYPSTVAGFTDGNEIINLIRDAKEAIRAANLGFGKSDINILGTGVRAKYTGTSINEKRCTDFMSPNECKLMFNVCDPVLCPSSRCDLGGNYRVANVIQSGIIGSIALCLPNFPEVYIPVCLTGVHAGLDAYVQILKSYKACLQEQLDTGKVVGICDEIQSIRLCEFFWRNTGPFLSALTSVFAEKAYGQGLKGGGEYLTVKDAFTNMENSVDYFKNDYAVEATRAFNIRSTEEIGGEVCKMFVSSRTPGGSKFFDNLLQPDSPVQYHAWFDEIPYSEASVPATSHYKVFFQIYAGKDEGANFQVLLRSPSESVYVNVPDVVVVKTGFIPRGQSASEAVDFTAPAGYKEVCVRINAQEECGFKKVSTSFAINYISDEYYKEQLAKQDIRTTDTCISGESSLSGVLTTPNIQEGVQTSINPELEKKGVVRICASNNPGFGKEDVRWQDVGYCDDESVRCWLDMESVQDVIKNKAVEQEVYNAVSEGKEISDIIDNLGFLKPEQAEAIISEAEKLRKDIEKEGKAKKSAIEKKKFALAILETEDAPGVEGTTGLYNVFKKLELIENKGQGNEIKARAAYTKFLIYEVLVELLDFKDNVGGVTPAATAPAGTGTPTVAGGIGTGCDQCGVNSGICDRNECHARGKCYFVRSSIPLLDPVLGLFGGNKCYNCPSPSNTECFITYKTDKEECGIDPCQFKNCAWVSGINRCGTKEESAQAQGYQDIVVNFNNLNSGTTYYNDDLPDPIQININSNGKQLDVLNLLYQSLGSKSWIEINGNLINKQISGKNVYDASTGLLSIPADIFSQEIPKDGTYNFKVSARIRGSIAEQLTEITGITIYKENRPSYAASQKNEITTSKYIFYLNYPIFSNTDAFYKFEESQWYLSGSKGGPWKSISPGSDSIEDVYVRGMDYLLKEVKAFNAELTLSKNGVEQASYTKVMVPGGSSYGDALRINFAKEVAEKYH